MYYLRTEAAFDSAHFLKGYKGKCSNLHGHRWRVVAEFKSDVLKTDAQTGGMVEDYGVIKADLKCICDEMDHCFIYEKDSLKPETKKTLQEEGFRLFEKPYRPTAENIAADIFGQLKGKGFNVSKVEVYETPANCAVYEE